MPAIASTLGRAAALAAALGLGRLGAAAGAAGQAAQACAARGAEGEAGACRPEAAPRLEKDHLLLQVPLATAAKSAVAAAAAASKAPLTLEEEEADKRGARLADPAAQGQRCESWRVMRRRRNVEMCSCRRRSGRQDLPRGWKCNEAANVIEQDGDAAPPPQPGGAGVIGWSNSGEVKAAGSWCQVNVPPPGWHLKSCPVAGGSTPVKVLTYNLYWWNLFGRRGGNGGSAGQKIASTAGHEGYDLMGFQECDDMSRILRDAHSKGLAGDFQLVNGGRALAIAWRKSRFTWLSEGMGDVGEDHHSQYYGKRSAQWVRLQHSSGRTVFFLNHHGPLPVSKSGGCTGSATAYNILKMVASNAHADDMIIVVGDFNAQSHSSRIQTLDGYLNRVFTGSAMGGVDHVFSNCLADSYNNLGKGGSDHDALNAVFKI